MYFLRKTTKKKKIQKIKLHNSLKGRKVWSNISVSKKREIFWEKKKKIVIPSQKMILTKQRDFFIKIKSRLVKKEWAQGNCLRVFGWLFFC